MSRDLPVLTLGALFHHLRNGLGDGGRFHVSIRFDQRSMLEPQVDDAQAPSRAAERSFTADMDFDDGFLGRAQLASVGAAGLSPESFSVTRQGSDWYYSLDGESVGILAMPPDLFDLHLFEERLKGIRATDVTVEELMREDGQNLNTLGVDLDEDAFRAVMALFGPDALTDLNDLDLDRYSLSLSAVDDVTMDYRWSMGTHGPSSDHISGAHQPDAPQLACQVLIRLQPIADPGTPDPVRHPTLPPRGRIDEVWELARASSRHR